MKKILFVFMFVGTLALSTFKVFGQTYSNGSMFNSGYVQGFGYPYRGLIGPNAGFGGGGQVLNTLAAGAVGFVAGTGTGILIEKGFDAAVDNKVRKIVAAQNQVANSNANTATDNNTVTNSVASVNYSTGSSTVATTSTAQYQNNAAIATTQTQMSAPVAVGTIATSQGSVGNTSVILTTIATTAATTTSSTVSVGNNTVSTIPTSSGVSTATTQAQQSGTQIILMETTKQ